MGGRLFFCVSIDIALLGEKGDLLRRDTQLFWLRQAGRGAIHLLVGGPPCETWSIVRFRYFTERTGPRPLRSGDHVGTWIWGLPVLLVKWLRQIHFGNSLLHFFIRMVVLQALNRRRALLEHPGLPDPRPQGQPASIWLLPELHMVLQLADTNVIPGILWCESTETHEAPAGAPSSHPSPEDAVCAVPKRCCAATAIAYGPQWPWSWLPLQHGCPQEAWVDFNGIDFENLLWPLGIPLGQPLEASLGLAALRTCCESLCVSKMRTGSGTGRFLVQVEDDDKVLQTVLQLFLQHEAGQKRLPRPSEVLFCDDKAPLAEVQAGKDEER
eukprot:s119_g81.t1